MRRILLLLLLMSAALAQAKASKPLQIYFVDVEGGQATLLVSPSGQSMLIDTGWPGFNGRDANRIADAAKAAGVTKIDYVIITHYHRDHVGGAPQLVQRIPVSTFIDHGPNEEDTEEVRPLYAAYQALLAKSKHVVVKPGDRIPVKGLD